MYINKLATLLGIIFISLFIIGCESSNIVDDLGNDDPNYVEGGTPEAPAKMSLDLQNRIVKNSYYNYYKYTASEDEKLKIEAFLEFAILSSERIACQEEGDTYIVVYDSKMNAMDWIRTCTSHLTVEFPADGTYIFQIKYPGNKGYFEADSSKK